MGLVRRLGVINEEGSCGRHKGVLVRVLWDLEREQGEGIMGLRMGVQCLGCGFD